MTSTTGEGTTRAQASEQRLSATIGFDRTLTAIESEPAEPRLSDLLGTVVGPGFRARLTEVLDDHVNRRTLLHTLLDDLPGAILVSGYAMQRARPSPIPDYSPPDSPYAMHILASEDMCSGWAADASILVTFRAKGAVPTPMGPEAPDLERPGDPLSWHAMAPLPREATRRRRRLDLFRPDPEAPHWTFDSHFRDSYCDAEGAETAVHEYLVSGVARGGVPSHWWRSSRGPRPTLDRMPGRGRQRQSHGRTNLGRSSPPGQGRVRRHRHVYASQRFVPCSGRSHPAAGAGR